MNDCPRLRVGVQLRPTSAGLDPRELNEPMLKNRETRGGPTDREYALREQSQQRERSYLGLPTGRLSPKIFVCL